MKNITNEIYLAATDKEGGELYTVLFNGVEKEYAMKNLHGISLEPEEDFKRIGEPFFSFSMFVDITIDEGDFRLSRILDEKLTNEYGIYEMPDSGLEKILIMRWTMNPLGWFHRNNKNITDAGYLTSDIKV